MITKFSLFKEAVNFQDVKNSLDLNLDQQQTKENPNQKQDLTKTANLKIGDIQKRLETLNAQKQAILDQITRLQSIQKDLVPETTDKNVIKNFVDGEQQKINIQTQKLNAFNAEILNLQQQVEMLKKTYL